MDEAVEHYWRLARRHARLETLPGYFGPSARESVTPPAWSFGATPTQADDLLTLVLDGTKTATSSALWDYQVEGEPLPAPGALGIIVDSHGVPRALVETTGVNVAPFDHVDEQHAWLEGEGDRSLAYWRTVHEEFFTEHAAHDRGFSRDMPVVLECFRVVYQ